MYECTKTFEIKPPAYSGGGSMLVHKGTLWYALESGRERTTLTDSRIKLVLSDRLFKKLTLPRFLVVKNVGVIQSGIRYRHHVKTHTFTAHTL